MIIDFPLPYVAVKELRIVEAASSHSTLTLRLISAEPLTDLYTKPKADQMPQ